jgi:anti-sigma regulatory factor (Ser/Thr protein kinase)
MEPEPSLTDPRLVTIITKSGTPLSLRFTADPRSAAVLRSRIGLWLDEFGASDEEVFEIALACNEAFANAVQHAHEPTTDQIDVEASGDVRTVTVVVRDYGAWANCNREEHGGRGLHLMHELMDSVSVDARIDGTSITLQRTLNARTLPPRARRSARRRRLRVHVDDPWLLENLCDYLAADGCLVEPVARSEAEVSIPGVADRREVTETLKMELRFWQARHGTPVALIGDKSPVNVGESSVH